MLTYLDSFLSDPVGMLVIFLLAFPGRILALSAHEFAHAWVANRCGDPTARMMGRMTLNPLKHLDPLGTVLMLLVGFGWAKPVPVNPRYYRNYRQDDLKVSLAGVTMNLILFALGTLLMTLVAGVIIATHEGLGAMLATLAGRSDFYSLSLSLAFTYWGEVGGYLVEMLYFFLLTNLVLCVFNLIPIPPLDGYHVLNDLILKRSLFANPNFTRYASAALFVLVMTGVVGRVLGAVENQVLAVTGSAAFGLLRLVGLMG